MANKKQNESWLLITFCSLVILFAVFFAFLFPVEALNLVNQHWYIIVPFTAILATIVIAYNLFQRLKSRSEINKITTRDRQIKLAEQLIWRGRYSLESQKAQILADNDPSTSEHWQKLKHDYIRSKLYPVVSEKDVPLNLASALIENAISDDRFRNGRLPTYIVRDVDY